MSEIGVVEGWVFDQEYAGRILSEDLYSLSGRWFDFLVDPDGVHIIENGEPVERVGDVAEAQSYLYNMTGIDDL